MSLKQPKLQQPISEAAAIAPVVGQEQVFTPPVGMERGSLRDWQAWPTERLLEERESVVLPAVDKPLEATMLAQDWVERMRNPLGTCSVIYQAMAFTSLWERLGREHPKMVNSLMGELASKHEMGTGWKDLGPVVARWALRMMEDAPVGAGR